MKTNKEILQIMLDNFDEYFDEGLCKLIYVLFLKGKILYNEFLSIREYIDSETIRRRLTIEDFWFEPKQAEPRKEWLKSEINK